MKSMKQVVIGMMTAGLVLPAMALIVNFEGDTVGAVPGDLRYSEQSVTVVAAGTDGIVAPDGSTKYAKAIYNATGWNSTFWTDEVRAIPESIEGDLYIDVSVTRGGGTISSTIVSNNGTCAGTYKGEYHVGYYKEGTNILVGVDSKMPPYYTAKAAGLASGWYHFKMITGDTDANGTVDFSGVMTDTLGNIVWSGVKKTALPVLNHCMSGAQVFLVKTGIVVRVDNLRTSGNELPVAMASADPTTGTTADEFFFSGASSYDPDGTIAAYAWQINGTEVSTAADFLHTFTATGSSLYSNIVAHWTFDDGTGKDAAGTNDAVLVGSPSMANSQMGKAMETRSTAYAVASSPDLNINGWTGLTVSVWLKPVYWPGYNYGGAAGFTTYGCLITHGSDNNALGYIIHAPAANNSDAGFGVFYSATEYERTDFHSFSPGKPPYPTIGDWYHLVGTYDGQTVRTYVNGVLDSTTIVQVPGRALWNPAGSKTYIGTACGLPYRNWGDQFFSGDFDDVAVWNRGLSSNEVSQLYNARTASIAAAGTYTVKLTVTDNYGATDSDELTVIVTEPIPSVVSVTVSDATAGEPGLPESTGKFKISRSGDLTKAITVNYAMSGTAANGTDYTLLSGTVKLAAGKASATVTVTPKPDALSAEGTETAVMTLNAGSGYSIDSTKASGVVAIKDQTYGTPVVSATTTDGTAVEPGLTANKGAIKISRTQSLHTTLTVLVAVSGTAANGVDYNTVVTPVVLAIGQGAKTISIAPRADAEVEGDETITMTIVPDAAYLIGAATAGTVTIKDNTLLDTPVVSIVAADAYAVEPKPGVSNNGKLMFSRTSRFHEALVINYVISGSASNGTDYKAITSTITIPAGAAAKSVTVTPKADTVPEGMETVTLTLGASGTYTINVAKAAATVTIAE